MPRDAAVPTEPTASLQSGLPWEHRNLFEQQLQGWFLPLKWLVKEFRLRVGYETPDEEAGIQFWIDRYEKQRGYLIPGASDPRLVEWPTADKPSVLSTAEEVQQARRWVRAEMAQRMAQLFELRRRLCPHTPILVPLQQLQHYEAGHGSSATHRQANLHQFTESQQKCSVVTPPGTKRRPSRTATPGKKRAERKVLSRETADRLFPMSVTPALTDAQNTTPHAVAGLRPLRYCETEEVHRHQVAARREVYGALEGCTAVESELEIRHRAQQREDDAMLRVSEAQMQSLLQGIPGTRAAGPPLRPGERPQMCATFLDTGTCGLGDACPYAHQPAELTGHSRQSLEGLLQMHRLQEDY